MITSRTCLLATLSVLALGAAGCSDAEGRYRAFLERTDGMRGTDAGSVDPSDPFDWSGRYLLGLSTVLAPDQPLLLEVIAEVSSDLSSVDLRFQPLTTDADDEPRIPIGDSFSVDDVAYASDGSVSADLGRITLPGRANPISGLQIIADAQLSARTRASDDRSGDVFCGQVTGMLLEPLLFDLAGSTFGAVLGPSLPEAELLLRCPQER